MLRSLGFPIRIGIVEGRILNTIQQNIRIVRIFRIFRISGQFHIKLPFSCKNRHSSASQSSQLSMPYLLILHGEGIRMITLKLHENVKKSYSSCTHSVEKTQSRFLRKKQNFFRQINVFTKGVTNNYSIHTYMYIFLRKKQHFFRQFNVQSN